MLGENNAARFLLCPIHMKSEAAITSKATIICLLTLLIKIY